MKNGKYIFIILHLTLIFAFPQFIDKDNELNNLINDYYIYSDYNVNTTNINSDNFVSGNINNNSTVYYNLYIPDDSDQILFDYQSDYGCIYISFENNTNISFQFCSKGENNLFILNKSDILEKIGDNDNNDNYSIEGLSLIIGVGLSYFEIDKGFDSDFDYSLKINLRKPDINIFEINSEHKILCKSEKINENNYRCLFIITNKNNEEKNDLIIYSTSHKKNIKLNIYSDYINKTIYENWDFEYLSNNIPNINSSYNNYNSEYDFIIIPNVDSDKYIYLSIEIDTETIIEVYTQFFSSDDEIELPKINDIKIYSINNSNVNFDFNHISINETSVSLGTLYGKASIHLDYDDTTEYITDIIENKLNFNIDLNSCKIDNNCNLKINKLEDDDERLLGYIFYIKYTKQSNNELKELEYGKSNKIVYTNLQYPILLYQQIINFDDPININLQIYNIPDVDISLFDIDVLIISKNQLYNIKLNNSYINEFNDTIKRKFDSIYLASNIYLSNEEMELFKYIEGPYIIISISHNNTIDILDNLIIGSTISQINSLIDPSERIYHYGHLKNEEKIVYRLKGKNKYNLMRLEFGCNSNFIGWSAKRTNGDNYRENDTDLSFVTEEWNNGRELLTMYIENGEDIYLTIFPNDKIIDFNFTNFIFKYINSDSNEKFNTYLIRHDSLDYEKKNKKIFVNKFRNIPSNSKVDYYLKIIKYDDYIKNELINTIALTESKYIVIKGKKNSDSVSFDLNKKLYKNSSYYLNAFSIIKSGYSDIEYISYKGLIIYAKYKSQHKKLGLASFILGGISFLFIIIHFIYYCYEKRRTYSFDDFDFGGLLSAPLDYSFHTAENDDSLIDDVLI